MSQPDNTNKNMQAFLERFAEALAQKQDQTQDSPIADELLLFTTLVVDALAESLPADDVI